MGGGGHISQQFIIGKVVVSSVMIVSPYTSCQNGNHSICCVLTCSGFAWLCLVLNIFHQRSVICVLHLSDATSLVTYRNVIIFERSASGSTKSIDGAKVLQDVWFGRKIEIKWLIFVLTQKSKSNITRKRLQLEEYANVESNWC